MFKKGNIQDLPWYHLPLGKLSHWCREWLSSTHLYFKMLIKSEDKILKMAEKWETSSYNRTSMNSKEHLINNKTDDPWQRFVSDGWPLGGGQVREQTLAIAIATDHRPAKHSYNPAINTLQVDERSVRHHRRLGPQRTLSGTKQNLYTLRRYNDNFPS